MSSTTYNLSNGALQIIMRGGDYEQPIVQVLGSKRINSGAPDKHRFRILLSDGKYSISFAMMTTQINELSDGIPMYSVIKIDRFITSVINNTGKGDQRVLLILDMKIIIPGVDVGEKIGNPTPLTDVGTSNNEPIASVSTQPVSRPAMNGNSSSNLSMVNGSNGVSLANQLTHPIASLSPYHNKWIIKARVTNKSAIRSWSNSRGEGKLFSMDLVDESGEIRLTGFRDAVDKFYDYVQIDKVYYISKCQLKPANKQYSTLKNDYEMTMTSDTIFQECLDDDISSIPQTQYDFVTIENISNMEPGNLVDAIGVVKNVGDVQTFQAKSTGRELKKREVILVDQSNTAITLTLWGQEAENLEFSNNPVVVIKGARLSEFGGGKNLSTVSSTLLRINPEMKECYQLRGWYDNEGNSIEMNNVSARTGSGSFAAPWMSFKEVQDQGLGNAEKGDYYQVFATILLMRSENMMYKACPTEDCKKKVVDLENGMYRCEKCNREFPNFKYRLLASLNLGDWSGNQWVSMFSSEVERVLGMTAEQAGEVAEQNPENLSTITDKVHFKQFVVKCRAKMETYNDEPRLKTVCIKVDDVNYEEHNAHLIERIQQYIS